MSSETKSSTKAKILVQLDCDSHPSTFDAVVAIDSGVDHLLQYGGVQENEVVGLVHGCMFTRGVDDLRSTAVFIGGSNVASGRQLADKIRSAFFGPMRVSVMLDGNGSNTTAAAAVVTAHRNIDLSRSTFAVLGATGPVGSIVAKLLAKQGATVKLISRDQQRAQATADEIADSMKAAGSTLTRLSAHSSTDGSQMLAVLQDCHGVIACGAAGVTLLTSSQWKQLPELKLLIDLNAVPPSGIEDVQVFDAGKLRENKICYGAIGVGGLKMKIHKAALKSLFEANDRFLDSESIFEIGLGL